MLHYPSWKKYQLGGSTVLFQPVADGVADVVTDVVTDGVADGVANAMVDGVAE